MVKFSIYRKTLMRRVFEIPLVKLSAAVDADLLPHGE
jgi:hypothetical protein